MSCSRGAQHLYALLVGINDYAPNVGKLSGCINDIDNFHCYLTDKFDKSRLRIELLKDADATRPNVIQQFRSHLGKAKADDVVVFEYCGHGARWKSAKTLKQLYPYGMDEGLVCLDSRSPGGFDLADKELAVLLAELAKNEPHIAVILNSCLSGSATRSADDFSQGSCRQIHEVLVERPLLTTQPCKSEARGLRFRPASTSSRPPAREFKKPGKARITVASSPPRSWTS